MKPVVCKRVVVTSITSNTNRKKIAAALSCGALLVYGLAFAKDWGSFPPWPAWTTYGRDSAEEWIAASNAPRALGWYYFFPINLSPKILDTYKVTYPDGPMPTFRVFVSQCSWYASFTCGPVSPN